MQFKAVGRALGVAASLMAGVSAASLGARAAEPLRCASAEEGEAFRLRHLQSRLMVAALGCNQQAAYNSFVEHFRPLLVSAGGTIADYFKRTGGGQAALNRHITELANAAGLSRAQDPNAFCKNTWELFWALEQDPPALTKVAELNTLATPQPQVCTVTLATGVEPPSQKKITATLDSTKAAVDLKK